MVEQFTVPKKNIENEQIIEQGFDTSVHIDQQIEKFCGEWRPETEEEQTVFLDAIQRVNTSVEEPKLEEKVVIFDKYKKSFSVDGHVVPKSYFGVAPLWGKEFQFEEGENFPLEYRQMRSLYKKARIQEDVSTILTPVIARIQGIREQKNDALKSNAYNQIAARFESATSIYEQKGFQAERVIRSFLTRISLDRQDLHVAVYPANPYQDVEEKIDFIIEATTKKRGVKVEEDEQVSHTLGIQFTINTSKIENKQDQIEKAKTRIQDVDDILLVSMKGEVLSDAIRQWEKSSDVFQEPATFLRPEVKEQLLRELLSTLLEPEVIEQLVKKYT